MGKKRITGINYLQVDEGVYKTLIENKVIDMLKFPGVKCDLEEMKKFLNLIKETGAIADVHGIPGIIPRLHAENCAKNVVFSDLACLKDIKGNERFSTHFGAFVAEGSNILGNDMTSWNKVLVDNLKAIRDGFKSAIGKDVEIGGENKPGGGRYDARTVTPEFVSESWNLVDFGVFDVSHALLAAKDLYSTGTQSDEYLLFKYIEALKLRDKVTTIHISGNKPENSDTKAIDSHVECTKEEIKILYDALKYFPNANILISEYAYHKVPYELASSKQICVESVILNNIDDLNLALEKKEFMERNLLDDLSNLEDCLVKVKK